MPPLITSAFFLLGKFALPLPFFVSPTKWFSLCLLALLVLGVVGVAPSEAGEIIRCSGIDEIDEMDGFLFEQRVAALYSQLGYSTTVTQASGDFGADVLMERDGIKTVVQVKRYSSPVGLEAVQQAAASKTHYGASHAMVLSNSTYTDAAKTLAFSNGVELVDRYELIKLLAKTSESSQWLSGRRLLFNQIGSGVWPLTMGLLYLLSGTFRFIFRVVFRSFKVMAR